MFGLKKDLKMQNENVRDLKHKWKQPLSELKIYSQSVKLVVKMITGRKLTRQNFVLNAGNSFLNPLEFKIFFFFWGGGGGGGGSHKTCPPWKEFTVLALWGAEFGDKSRIKSE